MREKLLKALRRRGKALQLSAVMAYVNGKEAQ
jgi:hypothetical protein